MRLRGSSGRVRAAGVTPEPADQTAFDGAATSLADEWFVLITKPHLCAALAARQFADGRYEYVYTHDEGAVARAAHAFVGVLLAARG